MPISPELKVLFIVAAINAVGSLLEVLGRAHNKPWLVSVGQKLEALPGGVGTLIAGRAPVPPKDPAP